MIKPDDYARIVNACNQMSINDADLTAGIEFYTDLRDKLGALGPVWSWAYASALRKLYELEGYVRERQNRRST